MDSAIIPTTDEERAARQKAYAEDFAALHRKEERAPQGTPIVIVLVVWGAVLSVGLAWAVWRLL